MYGLLPIIQVLLGLGTFTQCHLGIVWMFYYTLLYLEQFPNYFIWSQMTSFKLWTRCSGARTSRCCHWTCTAWWRSVRTWARNSCGDWCGYVATWLVLAWGTPWPSPSPPDLRPAPTHTPLSSSISPSLNDCFRTSICKRSMFITGIDLSLSIVFNI